MTTKKFRELSVAERAREIADACNLTSEERDLLCRGAGKEHVGAMIENVGGFITMPVGFVPNLPMDGKIIPYVPLCIEESSVVAALCKSVKMFGGGFSIVGSESAMTVQLFFENSPHLLRDVKKKLGEHRSRIAQQCASILPRMVGRGGGFVGCDVRRTRKKDQKIFTIVNIHFDVRDAMGANAVNTLGEGLMPYVHSLVGGERLMAILTNMPLRRKVLVWGKVPCEQLFARNFSGEDVARRIVSATDVANQDMQRAVTHNKGIMNGIGSVALALGQDWRAIEAGAHGYAARGGRYRSLSTWSWFEEERCLLGALELPLAVGTAGAAITANPTTRLMLKILGNPGTKELAGIMACIGLASNLMALRALVTEGIQAGHMACHQKQIRLAKERE